MSFTDIIHTVADQSEDIWLGRSIQELRDVVTDAVSSKKDG